MKRLLFIILLCVIPNIVFAETGEIPCINEESAGWRLTYEKNAFNGENIEFYVYNNTGITAFQVTVAINVYDFFGNSLGVIKAREAGPLKSRYTFKGKSDKNTHKMTCEIYWFDSYKGFD